MQTEDGTWPGNRRRWNLPRRQERWIVACSLYTARQARAQHAAPLQSIWGVRDVGGGFGDEDQAGIGVVDMEFGHAVVAGEEVADAVAVFEGFAKGR